MKKYLSTVSLSLALALSALTTGCTESLEEKAAREASEYTQKMCPTPFVNDSRTDSATFDANTKTFVYYISLRGVADNADIIQTHRQKLRDAQKASLDNNPSLKLYKDNHFSFRFIYRSYSQKEKVLMDERFKY